MDIGTISLWVGITAFVLAVPLAILANLLTPRVASYLARRKLIKGTKSREQALIIYNRIKAFREGTRDRYAFYIVLLGASILCAIASSTLIVISPRMVTEYDPLPLALVIAALLAFFSIFLVVAIYETGRRVEHFEQFKAEFEKRWGPID